MEKVHQMQFIIILMTPLVFEKSYFSAWGGLNVFYAPPTGCKK